MSNQIIECGPCYELKYDETTECLRDQTFAELKISYGRGSKLQCSCWGYNREYKADQSFITHMKSNKHINWREEQQKEHKQKYGHCISSEKIIETLRKEIREYKRTNAISTEIISKKEEKLNLLSKKLDEVIEENEFLKAELEHAEYENENDKEQIDLTASLKELKMENDALKTEIEEYQKDLIDSHKVRDRLQHELNSRKAVTIKKKQTQSLEQRQPFR